MSWGWRPLFRAGLVAPALPCPGTCSATCAPCEAENRAAEWQAHFGLARPRAEPRSSAPGNVAGTPQRVSRRKERRGSPRVGSALSFNLRARGPGSGDSEDGSVGTRGRVLGPSSSPATQNSPGADAGTPQLPPFEDGTCPPARSRPHGGVAEKSPGLQTGVRSWDGALPAQEPEQHLSSSLPQGRGPPRAYFCRRERHGWPQVIPRVGETFSSVRKRGLEVRSARKDGPMSGLPGRHRLRQPLKPKPSSRGPRGLRLSSFPA